MEVHNAMRWCKRNTVRLWFKGLQNISQPSSLLAGLLVIFFLWTIKTYFDTVPKVTLILPSSNQNKRWISVHLYFNMTSIPCIHRSFNLIRGHYFPRLTRFPPTPKWIDAHSVEHNAYTGEIGELRLIDEPTTWSIFNSYHKMLNSLRRISLIWL